MWLLLTSAEDGQHWPINMDHVRAIGPGLHADADMHGTHLSPEQWEDFKVSCGSTLIDDTGRFFARESVNEIFYFMKESRSQVDDVVSKLMI